jgi:two-component system sensor histidine kinase DesK
MHMPRAMVWLPTVVRVVIAPVVLGAIALLIQSPHTPNNLAAVGGLVLLTAIHLLYWGRPWPTTQSRAIAAAASMVAINFVLLNLLGVAEPLLWLYPALIAGAGLSVSTAIIGVSLTALAAAMPLAFEGRLIHVPGPFVPTQMFGPSHSTLVSILLAGLGMAAVRQLISVNADLEATRAELAEVAVAADRERLAKELHDLLGRTLSLIAVKAELASRLSGKGDPSAAGELADVQRLARQAVRDVRDAVTGAHSPSVEAELAAAESALHIAGIDVCIDNGAASIDPAHESTMAWAIREGVTNVVKHSGARRCSISLEAGEALTVLDIEDDGHGANGSGSGTGLPGLADRVNALGGTLEVGPGEGCGFRLRVRLGTASPQRTPAEVAP